MRKFFWVLFGMFVLIAPRMACAATETVSLVNPLGEKDVRIIIGHIISAALSVAGSLAILMVVYGGLLWMTSRGESKQVQKGKDTLTWAVLGIVIIFASYVIVNALILGITTGSVS
ncbi:MAG: hypothetical protein WCT28_00715 [Patescibacteria group bacterium]|jgi:hypothetical protein